MALLVKACVVLVIVAIILIICEKLFQQPPDEIEDWDPDDGKDDAGRGTGAPQKRNKK